MTLIFGEWLLNKELPLRETVTAAAVIKTSRLLLLDPELRLRGQVREAVVVIRLRRIMLNAKNLRISAINSLA
jgi:hypothetical protein